MANTHSLDLEASSSQYASIADASQTGLDITGDLTYECWFKPESSPSSGSTFCLGSKYGVAGGSANNRSYQFQYFNDSGVFKLGMNNSSDGTSANSASSYVTITELATGTWHHLAFVYTASSGTVEIYINGTSAGSNTGLKTSIFNGNGLFCIGAATEGSGSFTDGRVDDVRLWNDVRTSGEISGNFYSELVGNESGLVGYWKFNNNYLDETSNNNDLTSSGSPIFSTDSSFNLLNNIVSYWKFDEASGNASDSSGSNTLTNASSVSYGTGKINNGIDLVAASSDHFTITDASQSGLDITGNISFSCWVKATSFPTANDNVILSKYDYTGSQRSYAISVKDTGVFQAYFSDDGTFASGHGIKKVSSSLTLSTGVWTHLVVTLDLATEEVVFYKNGVAEIGTLTSGTAIGSSIHNGTATFMIGAWDGTPTNFWNGSIDEVGLWTRVLNIGEIKSLYNGGTGLSYSFYSTIYELALAASAFTLTGVSALFTSARTMAMSAGSFALTGIDALFAIAKVLVADAGSFILTGVDAGLNSTRSLALAAGSFALTGVAATFIKAMQLIAETGTFILTGISAILRKTGWSNESKPSSSWTNDSKQSSSWTNESK